MGKKIKTGKARKDRFYYLAKETGYRSRAAFKLIQLNRRFNFLNTSRTLVDLCAAPGGWLQVASKEMPVASQIIGVDLVPIQPIPRVKTLVADITTEKCKHMLRQELMQNKADVVLHDGAPNVGTAWSIDEFSQANLCLQAFALATDVLRKGGWFITKIFRSRDYEPFKWVMSQFFRSVRAIKPEASRMESAEIFLIGQFYLAPDRIDSRFLDSRHVFGEVESPVNRASVVSSFLRESKKKKKADGYAEGDTLYHEIRVSDFISSSDPLETLAKANKITFDLPEIEKHPLTTSALKADLEDIQVLGKADIRNILKWRKRIIATMNPDIDNTQSLPEVGDALPSSDGKNSPDGEDNDLAVEEEVQRLLHEETKQQKKRIKRVRKAKIKAAERMVLKMDHPGDRIEQEDTELFSLSTLQDLVGLEKAKRLIGDTSVTGSDAFAREEQAKALKALRDKRNTDLRSAIEGAERMHFERRGDDTTALMEHENVESAFQRQRNDLYLSSESEDEAVRLDDRVSSASSDGDLSDSESELDLPPDNKRAKVQLAKRRPALPTLDHFEQLRQKRNPLLVDLDDADEATAGKRKIRSWIESDEMKDLLGSLDGAAVSDELSNSDSDGPNESDIPKKTKKKKAKNPVNKETAMKTDSQSNGPLATSIPSSGLVTNDSVLVPSELRGMKKLRRPLTAEERALATRLIRSAKARRELIESAYHRMQFFEDPAQLPDWFVEDEKKHMRKPLPVKKEEVLPDRPTMGRSINKVEEAKLRKRARLSRRLKRIRQKAEGISDDIPETEKWQQIKQMYKKAGLLNKKRRPVHLIVNTKAGARNPQAQKPKGAKVKIVDRRMKADQRGQRRATAKKGGRRTGRPIRLLAHKPRKGGKKRN